MASGEQSLGELAKRWLRAKKSELLAGNAVTHREAEQEAGNAQRHLGDQAINSAAMAMLPGLRRPQAPRGSRASGS